MDTTMQELKAKLEGVKKELIQSKSCVSEEQLKLALAREDVERLKQSLSNSSKARYQSDAEVTRLNKTVKDQGDLLKRADKDIKNLKQSVSDVATARTQSNAELARLNKAVKEKDGLLKRADEDIRTWKQSVHEKDAALSLAKKSLRTLTESAAARGALARRGATERPKTAGCIEERLERVSNAEPPNLLEVFHWVRTSS
jgi:chromosome segregation ATPase